MGTRFFGSLARGPADASPGRASGVPGERALEAARAPSSRRQKFTSAVTEDAPGCSLSSVAARSLKGCPFQPRRMVFSPASPFSLLPPPNSASVPNVGVKFILVPAVLISFYSN